MVIAIFRTRNFEFTALGANESEATAALLVGWERHAAQYGADPDLAFEGVAEGDVNFIDINAGQCARDGEVLR